MTAFFSKRRSGILAAATSAAVLSLLSTTSAAADPATDGFWYFDVFHIQAAHDAGLTGEGVTIAVIDSQINLELPTLQGADIDVQPSTCYDASGELIPPTTTDLAAEHGSNIVSYLVGSGDGYDGQHGVKGIVPDARIIYTLVGRDTGDSVECLDSAGNPSETALADGINAAIEEGANIISASVNVGGSVELAVALAEAEHRGIVIITAVQNEGFGDADPDRATFPAVANGVVGVQSMDSTGAIQGTDDVAFNDHNNPLTDVVGPGVGMVWQGDESWEQLRYARGTSIATPIVAGFLALVAQKYPDATGNQLIQTLIRNTGTEDHELFFDPDLLNGYGAASATHMLAVDPTQYEDVNPLVVSGNGEIPTEAEIADPPTLEEALGIDEVPEPDAPSATSAPALLPLVIGASGFIVLAVVVIIVIARRSRRRAS